MQQKLAVSETSLMKTRWKECPTTTKKLWVKSNGPLFRLVQDRGLLKPYKRKQLPHKIAIIESKLNAAIPFQRVFLWKPEKHFLKKLYRVNIS